MCKSPSRQCPACAFRCKFFQAGLEAGWWTCDFDCGRCRWPRCKPYASLFKRAVKRLPVHIISKGRELRVMVDGVRADHLPTLARLVKDGTKRKEQKGGDSLSLHS